MRYLGNKTRLSKYLKPYLTKHLNGKNAYVEPFCGACGMISNIGYGLRIASDADGFIVNLMREVRDGWIPPEQLLEERYIFHRELSKQILPDGEDKRIIAMAAFAGYGCSFGGKWFGGLARGGENNGKPRNHVAESSRNLVKLAPKLKGIHFINSDYKDLEINYHGSVIYNDPPYSTGTKYKTAFDHNEFWEWVRKQSKVHYVYSSEYNAPDDFVSIWQKEHKIGIDHAATTHKITVEKLFVYKDGLSYADSED